MKVFMVKRKTPYPAGVRFGSRLRSLRMTDFVGDKQGNAELRIENVELKIVAPIKLAL